MFWFQNQKEINMGVGNGCLRKYYAWAGKRNQGYFASVVSGFEFKFLGVLLARYDEFKRVTLPAGFDNNIIGTAQLNLIGFFF